MSIATPPTLISAVSTPRPQLNATGIAAGSSVVIQSVVPSPATFDIIPLLHELVSRVLLSENNDASTSTSSASISVVYSGQQPIATHQLAAEVSIIRNRIRKARAAVEALPDIDIDLLEQEMEIEDLRTRIEKQRRVIMELNLKR